MTCFPSNFYRLLSRLFLLAGSVRFYLGSSAAAQDLDSIGAAGIEHVRAFSAVFVPLMVAGVVFTLIVVFSAWILSIIIASKD